MRSVSVLVLVPVTAWLWASARDEDRATPSTRAMASLLRERAAAVDPSQTPYVVNDRRADLLREALQRADGVADEIRLRFDYASELINAGRIPEALAAIDALRRQAELLNPTAWRRAGPMLLILKAVAYLRLAEEQNCCAANNSQSCLLPIRGTGIHRRTEGARGAVAVLEEVLTGDPDNLRARWLLNVAHMTLGGYPDRVPPRQLIPPAAFAAERALPRFPNVARDVGLDILGLSGGAILDDFDRDGRLDLLVSSIGFEDPLRFLSNEGDGRFRERTAAAGLAGETGGLNLIQADYDNDGWLDAVVLRGGWLGVSGRFPLSLLRNLGDGRFSDVTRAAGLLRFAPTQTATWLDYDGDGWLDLYVGNESTPGAIHPCELYRNNRDGTFTEVAAQSGVDVIGFVKAVVSGDYNNDGRPDLYLSLGGADNILLRNDGPTTRDGRPAWRFTDVAASAGVQGPKVSFPAAFFDYDNDGWLDLFVAGYGAMAEDVAADYLGLPTAAERGRLYRNAGNGTFSDVTREAGLYRVAPAMGMNFGDLDNDGFLDLYLGTGNPDLSSLVPNRMFRNDAGRRFQDVTTAGDFGHLQKGHAIGFGDVDNDGDQDVFEQMGGAVTADRAYSVLYENPGGPHAWLGIELAGVRSNRGAIGARVKVVVETENGLRTLHRTVGSGGSFGASPLRLEIGLGRARKIVAVEVDWPATGSTQTARGLRPGQRYRIEEGAGDAVSLERPSFRLAGSRRR